MKLLQNVFEKLAEKEQPKKKKKVLYIKRNITSLGEHLLFKDSLQGLRQAAWASHGPVGGTSLGKQPGHTFH